MMPPNNNYGGIDNCIKCQHGVDGKAILHASRGTLYNGVNH
jgi:hypothetical protein